MGQKYEILKNIFVQKFICCFLWLFDKTWHKNDKKVGLANAALIFCGFYF